MKLYLLCPTCGSDDIMKNGTTRRGKQNHKCRDCGRQFVEDPQWKPIDPERKAMVDWALLNLGMFLNVKPLVSHSKTSHY